MKKLLLIPFLFLSLIAGCSSEDTTDAPLAARTMLNVAYGSDAEQKMDVYLPAGRDENTKVIVLVHGGSWVGGDKNDMSFMVPIIQQQFPHYAIVNLNYRLATTGSPMHPKQINDIKNALEFIEENNADVSDDYAFVGVSAGAHLSMLYSYKHDIQHDVKAIVDIVGPADFKDPAYTVDTDLYQQSALTLLGTTTPTEGQITEINPIDHITAQAPPTLSFYGGQDPLVPASQGPRLKEKLDQFGVYNEFNFYATDGHADWDAQTMQEVIGKTVLFLHNTFE